MLNEETKVKEEKIQKFKFSRIKIIHNIFKENRKSNTLKVILQNIGILLLIMLVLSCKWAYKSFQIDSFAAIVFQMTQPLDGVSSEVIIEGILNIPVLGLALFIIIKLLWVIFFNFKTIFIEKEYKEKEITKKEKIIKKIIISLSIIISIIYIFIKTDMITFIYYSLDESTLIEDNYVDPNIVNVTFPETKRNLVYIILESMESTFTDEENGGVMKENLIPFITTLAKDNITFSNTEKVLGGAVNYPGTFWTAGSLAAQTTGLPLKLSIEKNSYGSYRDFLPGASSIGEILEKNGYINEFICGSDITFAGRDKLFKQHGNYKIFDYNYAKENGLYEHGKIWWGFQDYFLFDYAKREIIDLANSGKPFNATILTADTHHPYGVGCPKCMVVFPDSYTPEQQYSDIIKCSDHQLEEFITWLKNEPFYENTTVIIVGDHTTMSPAFEYMFENNDYERTTVNIFMNVVNNNPNTKYTNRSFSQMDMFPTTLSAMGATIEGDKLGIGTNLFSDKQTLSEEYGHSEMSIDLEKKSKFYNNKILNKD